MATKMLAKDAISSALAECYITIQGKRKNFMQALNVSIKVEKTKKEVPILGQVNKGNKSVGMKITGKAKFHYNLSEFRQLLLDFQNRGEDIYFDMQITNEDPGATDTGRQTVIVKGCNINGGLIAAFDAEGDFLTDEIDFTAERFEMPERFKELPGV